MLMDILGIVIGFCSIMLIFSLLVTAMVHGTQAALNMRVRNMRNVISSFMDQFPDIDTQAVLEKIDKRIPNNINPLVVPTGGKLFTRNIKLSFISKKELMCITDELLEDANDARNNLHKEIERSFDYLEEVMAQRFKQWMHQLAIAIAFAIAFVFQLNTFDLISNLNKDTALRYQAVSYGTQIQDTELSELEGNAKIEDVSGQLVSLQFSMFEHGWPYYLGTTEKAEAEVESKTEESPVAKPLEETKENQFSIGEVLQNWFGVICSAIFISLGAPFWFNSLKNVLDLRDKLAVVTPPPKTTSNVHSINGQEKRTDHG